MLYGIWHSVFLQNVNVLIGNPVMVTRANAGFVCGVRFVHIVFSDKKMYVVIENPFMDKKINGEFVCVIRNLLFCVSLKIVGVVVGNPIMNRKVDGDSVCDMRNLAFCTYAKGGFEYENPIMIKKYLGIVIMVQKLSMLFFS